MGRTRGCRRRRHHRRCHHHGDRVKRGVRPRQIEHLPLPRGARGARAGLMVVPIVCVTATVVVQIEEREAIDIRRNGRTLRCVARGRWDGDAAGGMHLRNGGEKGEGAAGPARGQTVTGPRRAVQK